MPNTQENAYKKLYKKALTTNSYKAAVISNCLDCMNWERSEVKHCTVTTCPCYNIRLYKGNTVYSSETEL